jgi:microsomal prostaglandin-E synthase 2
VIIYVGAGAMWMIGKRLQKRHNLKKDVRQSLFDESDYWITSIKKKGGKFMGGQSPNLADLAIYGVLSSIEGCQAFADLTSHSKPLAEWYKRMKSQLKTNAQLA